MLEKRYLGKVIDGIYKIERITFYTPTIVDFALVSGIKTPLFVPLSEYRHQLKVFFNLALTLHEIIKFNPLKKECPLSMEECLGPAMKITDPIDAQQYLKDYATYLNKDDFDEGLKIARLNLAYYSGYYSDATVKRVDMLFGSNRSESIKELINTYNILARISRRNNYIISIFNYIRDGIN